MPVPSQTFSVAGSARNQPDWMTSAKHVPSAVIESSGQNSVVLTNGIVSREWFLRGGAVACTSFKEIRSAKEFVRAVSPEARLKIDGRDFAVGGMTGQPDRAYLDHSWLDTMKPSPGFRLARLHSGPVAPRIDWETRDEHRALAFGRPVPHAATKPIASGKRLVFEFEGEGDLKGILVSVCYEIYDGLPLVRKQVIVHNETRFPHTIDEFHAEELAVVEAESSVDSQERWSLPNMTVTTDYTFAGMAMGASNKAVQWLPDPEYKTQVSYELKTPCLLQVGAPVGPNFDLAPGGSFETFSVFELLHDSTERERKSLQIRRMYRYLAPWVLENPIMLHLTSSDPHVVKTAIDQASECGFEMIVISFWSGLDMEDVSETNISKWKGLADYAHERGLELGGYSLLASRSVGPETDVIDPKTGKPGGAVFGSSPCLCSKWGHDYFEKLKTFISRTGFDLLEHDGSYPGDVCASTTHPGHKGLADSQWNQYQVISDFYRWCRKKGVFLNVPDNYHLAGSNKTGMGYRESNWSLPRAQQHIHARQNLFDGTWEKTPSMGWMMVPLVEYQGGGAEATIEPLKDHLADYEMHLANNFGFGAQACYRGPRLYDSPETKAAVVKWVRWFKEHRAILESDVIHIKRADGRGMDAVLHVDPLGKTPAMLVVWNPTDEALSDEFCVPLSFAGLSGKVRLRGPEGTQVSAQAGADGSLRMAVKVAGRSMSWIEIRSADK